jgi:hypothetical protein
LVNNSKSSLFKKLLILGGLNIESDWGELIQQAISSTTNKEIKPIEVVAK